MNGQSTVRKPPPPRLLVLDKCFRLCEDPPHGFVFVRTQYKLAPASTSDSRVLSKNLLAKHYPKHSIVAANPFAFRILGFPEAMIQPIPGSELDTVVSFIPFARRSGEGGALIQDIRFGGFNVAWKDVDLILYIIEVCTFCHLGPQCN